MNYDEMKTWAVENKTKLVVGVCFVLVFFVGFGAGRYQRAQRRDLLKPQSNYTTQAAALPQGQAAPVSQTQDQVAPAGTVAGAATSTTASGTCKIKGNISSSGGKIYHVPGGAFYDRTNPEQCFNTEAEAVAAGFRKSSR